MKTMKILILQLIFISIPTYLFSQDYMYFDEGLFHYFNDTIDGDLKTIRSSSNGNSFPTSGEFRFLNLFINIDYDETPGRNPILTSGHIWPEASVEGVNILTDIPNYLTRFMDITYNPDSVIGTMTRLYHEASFGNLILLGDFVVVNILQSKIAKKYDPHFGGIYKFFELSAAVNEAIRVINESGGLNTLYGHNSISDYDVYTKPHLNGLPKPMIPNLKIDFLQVMIRNTTYKDTTFINNSGDTIKYKMQWGGIKAGSGFGNSITSTKIKIGTTTYFYENGSVQCIGDADITKNLKTIVHHEFAHNLFGSNTFHTSGGNHYGGGQTNTFFGLEGGYGLMGAYNSGLVSCNGFERWRMNWTHQDPAINPSGNPIQARHVSNNTGIPSDISKEDGPPSFILRDFVTYGDVVRIKLPYKDSLASNQYIWLENHQIGRNDKLDYLNYTLSPDGRNWYDCRDPGTPGIYAYFQVGKDVLEGTYDEVYPTNETDNLRIISADGNWDLFQRENEYADCVNDWTLSRTVKRQYPNPLSGYQDQTTIFFEKAQSDTTFLSGKEGEMPSIVYNSSNQLITRSLPNLGDEYDAFTDISIMSIGSNPSPGNVTTHYTDQEKGKFTKTDSDRDNNHIYLSGLKIEMTENDDHTFKVDITWDDYDVSDDVRWAGNIVLKEKVVLKPGKTINLDQSLTPNQITRDPVSNLFVKPTVFTCDAGSEFILEDYSTLRLNDKSTLLLKSGSALVIENDASLIVNAGDTLKVESCAKLIIKGNGRLVVNNGGVLCISPGAIVATDKGMPNIYLNGGHIIPTGFIHPNQVVPPSTTISGNVTWSGKNYHVNTLTVNTGANLTISNSIINFGQDSSIVIIKKGGKITVNASTLSNSCGDTWRGIYVEGVQTLPQTFANQGAVIMQNGAIIENAKNAISLHADGEMWATNGGIVQATNSTFRNNWRDVEFMAYVDTTAQGTELPNISYFDNCTFETNNNTIHSSHIANVTMWNVVGVNLTDCIFADNRTDIDYESETAREGIGTASASYWVNNCSFTGLHYGIYATSLINTRTLKVTNSEISTYRGIYMNAMDNSSITGNTFTVAPGYTYEDIPDCDDTYGLYVDASTNFEITNNVFLSSGSQAPSCNSFGLIARNTGSNHNEIYRNDFTGFYNAIQATGNNTGPWEYDGLEIRCNRFYNTHYTDIYVTDSGIRELQGIRGYPENIYLAGNVFSTLGWYLNFGKFIEYYHHDLASHPNLLPYKYNSKGIEFKEPYGMSYDFSYSLSCPDQTRSSSRELLFSEMDDALQQYDETDQLLESYTDNGNTGLMTNQIEMTTQYDAWNTYQYLMQTSPFLSDDVLTTLAGKEDGLNHAMIRDIMVENPQSAKSDSVILTLDNRLNPLPSYMRWQINNGLYTLSEKEVMEQHLDSQKERYYNALNEIIFHATQRNEGWESPDELDQLLLSVDNVNYKYWLADLKAAGNDFAFCLSILNEIGQQGDFNIDDQQNHLNHVNFYTLLSQIDQNTNPGYSGLQQATLSSITDFLETSPMIARKARAILQLNNAFDYEEPIFYPEEEMDPKSDVVENTVLPYFLEEEANNSFNLYPNPARDYVTISWCFENDTNTEFKIDFYNSSGVLVYTQKLDGNCNQQIIPVSTWKSGAYTATLSGSTTSSVTFVVGN